MTEITEKELAAIVKLSESIPEQYRPKCFELLLLDSLKNSSARQSASKTEEKTKDVEEAREETRISLPIDVKAFLTQYKIGEDKIARLFIYDGTEIRPIYELSTTQKAVAQMQHTLLLCLEKALLTGKFSTSKEESRKRCQEAKCYDRPNFTRNISNNSGYFKSIDAEELTLAPEGKSALADIIDEIGN